VWVRVGELGGSLANLAPQVPQIQQIQPQIVYVINQPQEAPEQAAPTPAQQEAPAPQPLQQLAVLDRERWAVQAALSAPTPALLSPPASQPGDIDRANVQEAWRQEHCVGATCIP
jgi:hypothetical protein